MSLMTQIGTLLTEQVRSWWQGPLNSSDPELAKWFGTGPPSSTGLSISEDTALTYSAFWACVNAISTDVASVPLILYKRLKEGGKERYTDAKLYRLLHDEPNPEMSAVTFRQILTAHTLTWGNGYAEVQRNGEGGAAALWPLTPNRVTPFRQRGGIAYRVTRADGGYTEVPSADMLHIPGLGFDGLLGYSVVSKARESIGLGLATERFGGTFFGNGSTFGGVLSHPQNLSTEIKAGIRESIDKVHTGVERAHRFLILGGGTKFTKLGIPPNDAQFLETRLHQVEEMCRWFRMPPHKIQHLLRSTNNNIEHQGIEYYTDTMRPWCVRWEQEINRKLISPLERRQQFVEHMVEGVLRGDLASRYSAYAVGRQWGWLSVDDIRERENMNPLPNGQGKIYLVPMNMVPADKLEDLANADIKAKNQPPAPPQLPPKPEDEDEDDTDAGRALEAITAALKEAEARAEAHLAKAVALETENAQVKTDADTIRAAVEQERAAALDAAREIAALKALQLEAVERADRERAERDAARAERDRAQAALLEHERTAACAQTTIAALELACADVRVDAARLQELEVQLDALTAARDVMVAALETARQAERERRLGLVASHRALIVDAMERIVLRETDRARRNQATPAKLRAWAEAFYLEHEDKSLEALRPAIRTHLAAIGSTEDVDTVTRAYLQPQLAAALEQIRTVAGGDPDDFAVTLEKVLMRWETDRPAAIADAVLAKEIAHVGSL